MISHSSVVAKVKIDNRQTNIIDIEKAMCPYHSVVHRKKPPVLTVLARFSRKRFRVTRTLAGVGHQLAHVTAYCPSTIWDETKILTHNKCSNY